jgi:hypothetical protein
MKQDKFLTGIVIGIVALVVLALALFFTRRVNQPGYQTESTPEGVAFNYLLAIRKQDYAKAYSYLSEKEGKPTYNSFSQQILINNNQSSQALVDIRNTTIAGDTATVEIVVMNNTNDGIFAGGWENKENAILEKVDGTWKVTMMPYLFWGYDWYQTIK